MLNLKYLHAIGISFMLVGNATSQQNAFSAPTDYVPIEKIEISEKFQTVELTRDSLVSEMNRCVPQVCTSPQCAEGVLSRFPSKGLALNFRASSSRQFWALGSTGMCLQTSSERFLILSVEAFYDTVNPVEVPSSVADGWYKQFALMMARKGLLSVAYELTDGSAYAVLYWVDPGWTHSLFYSASLRKRGDWEQEAFNFRLSDPLMTSIRITKRSPIDKNEKNNLLSHRGLMERPGQVKVDIGP